MTTYTILVTNNAPGCNNEIEQQLSVSGCSTYIVRLTPNSNALGPFNVYVDSIIYYSGVSRNSICRLNNDGTLDTSFTSPFTNPNLYTLVVKQLSSGKILVGGDLEINGTYYGLVRLNSNGTLDTSFPYFSLTDRANDVEEQIGRAHV